MRIFSTQMRTQKKVVSRQGHCLSRTMGFPSPVKVVASPENLSCLPSNENFQLSNENITISNELTQLSNENISLSNGITFSYQITFGHSLVKIVRLANKKNFPSPKIPFIFAAYQRTKIFDIKTVYQRSKLFKLKV